MSVHEFSPAIAADLRAGSIDSGAALMIAEVVLQAIAELPGGRELIADAMARKAAEVCDGAGQHGDARISLMVMRGIVADALQSKAQAAA